MFSLKQFLPKAKRFFGENSGALFAMAFQILLLICGGLLIASNSVWADELAAVAYYFLVIGVVLQLISFLKHGKQEEEGNEL